MCRKRYNVGTSTSNCTQFQTVSSDGERNVLGLLGKGEDEGSASGLYTKGLKTRNASNLLHMKSVTDGCKSVENRHKSRTVFRHLTFPAMY